MYLPIPTEAIPSSSIKSAYIQAIPDTYKKALDTQIDIDDIDPHKLEEQILVSIRNNSGGPVPMDIGNLDTALDTLGPSKSPEASMEATVSGSQTYGPGDSDMGQGDGDLMGLKGNGNVGVRYVKAVTASHEGS